MNHTTGQLSGVYNGTGVQHLTYDDIDRLTDATQSYGIGSTLAATYSGSGRLCGRSQTFAGQDAVFGYDNGVQPHAPRRIFDHARRTLHDLRWDKNGNLAQAAAYDIRDNTLLSCRHLFWTEDSRLSAVLDEKYLSYYAYGHDGERVLKMTGISTITDINAERVSYSTFVDGITLYPSPYLVAHNKGYTKHYYAGTERVCARIGNGSLGSYQGSANTFIGNGGIPGNVAKDLLYSVIDAMPGQRLVKNIASDIETACGTTPSEITSVLDTAPGIEHIEYIVNADLFNEAMEMFSGTNQMYEEPYFYHGDHLGSAAWVTDRGGLPVQHLQYLPFGEPFVDQHSTFPPTYRERFTFTGKERDAETGYSYFGARYYDSDLSGLFLSVDPMADKYPSISPYAYCAWNPLKLVDPDGKEMEYNDDGWKIDITNKTITRVNLEGGDYTQFVDGDGAWMRNESRGDLLNEYKDFTVVDNVQGGVQLNPYEERAKSVASSPETIFGSIVGGVGLGCDRMSKAIFDLDNGTYMGKDGSTKIINKGKNGGLNGKYKSQIKASAKYAKAGKICNVLSVATSAISMGNTEIQYNNSEISNRERWSNHAIDIIGCTPVGILAPVAYELGKKYGPSTWF